ncbi:uncharacterized protein LOC128185532 [Crassostrea angulata]|uniref:uncharacterized protein LOC128185532 n=1 Tax=Magallana angulata TaxID=2784310 RepID=UPI0022B0EA98|nr:uncharacterized protein LOC128185532 [Crassostrea angulata]
MAYPNAPLDFRDQITKDSFIESLNEQEMEWSVFQGRHRNLEDAVRLALEYKAFQQVRGRRNRVAVQMQREEPMDANIRNDAHQMALISQNTEKNFNKKGPCFYCKKDGHIKSECRLLQRHLEAEENKSQRKSGHTNSVVTKVPEKRAVVDASSLTSTTQQKGPQVLEIKGSSFDFLREHNCQLHLGEGTLTLGDLKLVCDTVSDQSSVFQISIQETLSIPPRTIAEIEPNVSEVQTKNDTNIEPAVDTSFTNYVKPLWDSCTKNLSKEQQELVRDLLQKHIKVFAKSETDLGKTNIVSHKINTGDARPIKQQPRRIPLHKKEAAREEVQRMLKAGIIEPSSSAWSAPIV